MTSRTKVYVNPPTRLDIASPDQNPFRGDEAQRRLVNLLNDKFPQVDCYVVFQQNNDDNLEWVVSEDDSCFEPDAEYFISLEAGRAQPLPAPKRSLDLSVLHAIRNACEGFTPPGT